MAEIVVDALLPTGKVVTLNVVLVLLAAIVTVVGTVAADVLSLEWVMTAPQVGAGAFSVTVAVEDVPPRTDVGLKLRLFNTAGTTVSAAD